MSKQQIYQRTLTYLYLQKLKCPKCGRVLGSKTTKKKNGNTYFYYYCNDCKIEFKEKITNNELPKTKIDKRTGIENRLEGDYYIPNLAMPKQKKITLNRYGRMRLKYLKEHKKVDYTIMFMDGTLNTHLKEIQETADTRVQQIITELKAKSNLTEDMKNTDMLYWVGTMNSIKAQAEEIVFSELIYV